MQRIQRAQAVFLSLALVFGGCVKEHSSVNQRDPSSGEMASVEMADLGRPEALSAVPLEDTLAVQLSWNPVDGAEHYEIWRADRGGPVFTLIARRDSTAFLDRGVFPRSIYGYRVRAANDDGVGPYSDSVHVRTHPRPESLD